MGRRRHLRAARGVNAGMRDLRFTRAPPVAPIALRTSDDGWRALPARPRKVAISPARARTSVSPRATSREVYSPSNAR